jgi:hypothetical protein
MILRALSFASVCLSVFLSIVCVSAQAYIAHIEVKWSTNSTQTDKNTDDYFGRLWEVATLVYQSTLKIDCLCHLCRLPTLFYPFFPH